MEKNHLKIGVLFVYILLLILAGNAFAQVPTRYLSPGIIIEKEEFKNNLTLAIIYKEEIYGVKFYGIEPTIPGTEIPPELVAEYLIEDLISDSILPKPLPVWLRTLEKKVDNFNYYMVFGIWEDTGRKLRMTTKKIGARILQHLPIKKSRIWLPYQTFREEVNTIERSI
ncbi:MAG: hypothetical protein KKD05_00205 [Candidatus Omnitrophica bacterium]|nr:hypothetical protein [Candidatus Omnitrophota bacterium]